MRLLKAFFNNLREKWKADWLGCFLTISSWVFFASLICTLQLFTSMEGMSFIPIIFSALLFLTTIIYTFKKGKIAITPPISFLILFLLYAFFVTILTSKIFQPYFKTMVNISIMSLVIFLFCINFYRPKLFLIIYLTGAIALALAFAIVCRTDIFSLNPANAERIGSQFGNVNGVGLTFCFAIVCSSIYIVFYKKNIILLAILDFVFLFLILKTGSRSSFLIAMIALLLCLFLSLHKNHKMTLFICVSVLIVLIIILLSIPQFDFFRNRLLSLFGLISSNVQTEASARIRHDMQINGLELWLKKMFFGHGSEGFKQITSYPYFSHASLSEMLCNYGLIGFILFYFPFVYLLFVNKKGTLGNLIYLFLLISIIIPTLFFGIIFYEKPFFVFAGLAAAISFCENKENQKYSVTVVFTNWFKNIKINYTFPNICLILKKHIIRKPKAKEVVFLPCFIAAFSIIISSFSLTKKASYESVSSIVTEISTNDSITKSMNLNLQNYDSEVKFSDLKESIETCRMLTYSKTSGELYNYRLGYFSEFDTYFSFNDLNIGKFSMLPHTTSGIHTNSKKENVFDWYEIKMQYNTMPQIIFNKIDTFIEIRETTAIAICENLGISYNRESFKELIDKGLFVEASFYNKGRANNIKYQIANVIIENEGQDSFYFNTFGNYFCSYLRNGSIPIMENYSINYDFGSSFIENFKSFQFLENNFSREHYKYEISKTNLIAESNSEVNNRIQLFFSEYDKIANRVYVDDFLLSVIHISLCAIIFSTICLLNYKKRMRMFLFNKYSLAMLLFSYFCTYVLFYFLNVILNFAFVSCFSIAGVATSLIVCVSFAIIFSIFLISQKNVSTQIKYNNFYEIEC